MNELVVRLFIATAFNEFAKDCFGSVCRST